MFLLTVSTATFIDSKSRDRDVIEIDGDYDLKITTLQN
ncbi:hypothetical protein CKA32_003685 [Geitlerinema sp. FC II]|nr:hypothetical protein CKA32_003685 [Geitlerinema sp. FC II]